MAAPELPSISSDKSLLASALFYAARGWRVFPVNTWLGVKCSCNRGAACTSPAKHPRISAWQHEATTDPAQITRWWRAWPDANIGIATGPAPGLVVIDIDPNRGGEDSLKALVAAYRGNEKPFETVMCLTGGGGQHYYFRHPGRYVKSDSDRFGAEFPGLDVKGDGGYVLAPPSNHQSGGTYLWELSSHPDDLAVAPLPGWILSLLETRQPAAPATSTAGELIADGRRNATLSSMAGAMRRQGMTEPELLVALRAVNAERVMPPLPDAELVTIARSVARYTPEPDVAAPVLRIHSNGHAEPVQEPPQPETPPRWTPKPLSALTDRMEALEWLWYGFLAPGNITLFTGLWKAGKTTLLSYLLKALDGSSDKFAGFAVRPTRVLVVSEEHERHWAARRDDLAIADHVHIINRPFMRRADHKTWVDFIEFLCSCVTANHYDLVVIDSLHNMWPVADENSGSEVTRALMPITMLAELGGAVLLVGHPSKADNSEGRATRGSGASGGLVDIILEMRRYEASHRDDTRRVVTSYSRFDDTPAEAVFDWTKGQGYTLLGTKGETKSADRYEVVARLIPDGPPGLTGDELLASWPDEEIKPAKGTLMREIVRGFESGQLDRFGAGTKAKPYTYWKKRPPTLNLETD
jgi:hypothetical protein